MTDKYDFAGLKHELMEARLEVDQLTARYNKLVELVDQHIAAGLAIEDTGIYPAAVVRGGVETKRTEKQEGHNECVKRLWDKHHKIWDWLESLGPDVKPTIVELILEEKFMLVFGMIRCGHGSCVTIYSTGHALMAKILR